MKKPSHAISNKRRQTWWVIVLVILGGGLGYLLLLGSGYVAVRYGWTDESGRVDHDSEQFAELANTVAELPSAQLEHLPVAGERILAESDGRILRALCRVDLVGGTAPGYAHTMLAAFEQTGSLALLQKMSWVASRQMSQPMNYQPCEDETNYQAATLNHLQQKYAHSALNNLFPWEATEEWKTIAAAFLKDQPVVMRAAQAAGIEPRLLMSVAAVEQLRLYYTQRELFEKIFKPLQILASANKMAWGIMAIKESTAIEIENHLTDSTSPYYLGRDFERLLQFQTDNPTQERYDRLTNERDHFYSYLYGGLLIKQYQIQWQRSGVDIASRPEIVGTLFNIGFKNSHPKAQPEVGGSLININGREYTFGSLAFEVYYSGDMNQTYSMQ